MCITLRQWYREESFDITRLWSDSYLRLFLDIGD